MPALEEFRQIGEVTGSLKALVVFQDDIQINQKQCCLLVDMLKCAYKTIAETMKQNLRFEEKNIKWKIIENPLRELLRVFKEAEQYIKQSLETKDFWAKAIVLYKNTDCVEFHIHNLLSCVPIVIEAIEIAGEISGSDHDEIQKKRSIYSMKYQKECKDPRIFQWKFGKQYMVSKKFSERVCLVWNEDKWILQNKIRGKKNSGSCTLTKHEQRLADLLLKNLNEMETESDHKLLPSSILVNSKDYQIRRRLGSGSQYKEIQWLGETFCLRHLFGDIKPLIPDISQELHLSHPNIMHITCGFTDEEMRECFLIMELMNKDLSNYIKEICGPRKRVPFSLPVAIDLLLQIARGMEYLHSKKIYHGELSPSKILVKARNVSTEGYLHAKVCGFGSPCSINLPQKASVNQNNGTLPFIWFAPEVLAEQEQSGNGGNIKYSEKSDVYSFGMLCFEVLTGKVPFEDSHLQGDKMSRNIRAGERPLFPFHSPKYVTSLTKKCWHTDPYQRPSFSSISRVLRYVKRFLVMNPEHSQQDLPLPPVDYGEIEAAILRSFPFLGNSESDPLPITQIPFQMFAYRVTEKEKSSTIHRDINSESGSDGASAYGDDPVTVDDPLPSPTEKKIASPEILTRRLSIRKPADIKVDKQPGTISWLKAISCSISPNLPFPKGYFTLIRNFKESQLPNRNSGTPETTYTAT
ncbi:hypothetical protein RND71_040826 [Anisodus tanguticus]|uniref:Protein kinase domain-containing protein n=1 Tax=Anisodus tanguticus TaxID=243964 RepID=A0AAE1QUA3_9SOLA|nr:hypothetical protein RND71_040826 [Anisodus tanguticus]